METNWCQRQLDVNWFYIVSGGRLVVIPVAQPDIVLWLDGTHSLHDFTSLKYWLVLDFRVDNKHHEYPNPSWLQIDNFGTEALGQAVWIYLISTMEEHHDVLTGWT